MKSAWFEWFTAISIGSDGKSKRRKKNKKETPTIVLLNIRTKDLVGPRGEKSSKNIDLCSKVNPIGWAVPINGQKRNISRV